MTYDPPHAVYRGRDVFQRVVAVYYGQRNGFGGFAVYNSMEPAMWQRGDGFDP